MDIMPGMFETAGAAGDAYVLIWTTTPWTLPANTAVSLAPDALSLIHIWRRLRRKGLRGRTLGLRMRYDDRSVRSVQRQLPAPSDDELSYTPLLYRMADELWRPGMPVRLIGVAMTGFGGGESVQDSLFDIAEAAPSDDDVDPVIKDEAKRRGLIEATDLVKDKFGESAVRFGRELRGEGNTTGSASTVSYTHLPSVTRAVAPSVQALADEGVDNTLKGYILALGYPHGV